MTIGLLTLTAEQILEISQMPAPGWYHRQESDAWRLAGDLKKLSDELGMGEVLTMPLPAGGG